MIWELFFIEVMPDRDYWRALINTVTNSRVLLGDNSVLKIDSVPWINFLFKFWV